MSFESEKFLRSKPDFDKLSDYGFAAADGVYRFETVLPSGEFRAVIEIRPDGGVSGSVIDIDTLDEYNAFRSPDRTGEFVGRVREEYGGLLADIRQQCFVDMPFVFEQSNRIAQRVYDEFSERPDYPFATAPTYGVFRNSSNKKWYGLIMNVTKDKLTKVPEDKNISVEILNLKAPSEKIHSLTDHKAVFPCYHMNKGSWLSVLLDDTADDDFIMELLRESKRLTDKASRRSGSFIIPSNPRYYDIAAEFAKSDHQVWKQGKGIKKGDTVYIYVGSPYSAILYRCTVTETDIPFEYTGEVKIDSLMKITVTARYDKDKCPLSVMKKYGVTTVRGVRFMPESLEEFLRE